MDFEKCCFVHQYGSQYSVHSLYINTKKADCHASLYPTIRQNQGKDLTSYQISYPHCVISVPHSTKYIKVWTMISLYTVQISTN